MKTHSRIWLGAFCAAWLFSAAFAQPAPLPAAPGEPEPAADPQVIATECPHWRVFYIDDRLDVVIGDATIDWKDQLAVIKFPFNGKEFRLQSEFMQVPAKDDLRCQFRFKGPSPDGGATAPPDTAHARGMAGGGEAVVKSGREENHFAFGVPSPADEETVTVDLAVDEEGDMAGRWSYGADPLTQRDARGGGRVGQFSIASDGSFGGQQSGSEIWLQVQPEVDYAPVLGDQMLINYFSRPGQAEVDPDVSYRTLFVVGRNLPTLTLPGSSSYNVGRMDSSSPDTHYRYIGTSGDANLTTESKVLMRQGWIEVCRPFGKDVAKRKEVLAEECALIRVKLDPGYVPGIRELTWAGVKIPWRLETGEARAQVRFVRQIGDATQWENVPEAYLPEKVAVEVRLPQPIPYDSFTLKLRPFTHDAAGEGHVAGPEFETVAHLIAPQLYRTDPISLIARGAGGIVLQAGTSLSAIANATTGLLSAPAQGELRVTSSPGRDSPLWSEYVLRAAKTQGVDSGDIRTLEMRKETTFTKVLVGQALATSIGGVKVPAKGQTLTPADVLNPLPKMESLHTDIYFGHHAAMLLVRDRFVEMMRQRDVSLGGAVGVQEGVPGGSVGPDDAALGYVKAIRNQLRLNPDSAIGGVAAGKSKNGGAVTLAQAIDSHRLWVEYEDDYKARDKWLVGAVRQAVANQRVSLRKAIKTAEAILDKDIEGLLRLTGNKCEPVVEACIPSLMMLDSSANWVPDNVARGYVRGLAEKFQELDQAQKTADLDTSLALIIVQTMIGVPTFPGAALANLIKAVGNGIMFLASSASEIYDTYQAKDEIAFAFAASPVLGDARFQKATLDDPGWLKTLGMIAVNAAFTGHQVLGDLRQVQAALQVARGARVAEGTILSIYGLSTLTEAKQRDLLAFLAQARSLRAQGKALTGIQMAAANAFDELGALAAKDPDAIRKGVAMASRVRQAQLALAVQLEESLAKNVSNDLIADLRIRREALTDIWRVAEKDPRLLNNVTEFDLAWYAGKIVQPDEARALALSAAHDFNWHDLKGAFMDGKVSAAEMQNFVNHREQLMTKLLDESIAEVAAAVEVETKVKPDLYKKALGSKNLTSDLDFSVFGPGAERVVDVFNNKFRALAQFKGLESGHVFDTNVYTQAVYELFHYNPLVGETLGIANADLDGLRQFMYEQMATRKYIGGVAEWEKHTTALLGAAPDGATRKMLSATFEEAEYAYKSASQAIAKRMGVAGADALHAAEGTNQLLRATNESYVEVLLDINQWRTEMTRLQQYFTGQVGRLPAAPAEFLERYPGWRNGLAELEKLSGPENAVQRQALAKTWSERLTYQLRKKQGEALFFASEAYQSEATILHVVKDLQELGRGKLITLAKLGGGDSARASKVLSQVDGRGALNSMMENLANLRKELGHADDAAKAAAKGGKYFIRVLDAGHESGLDVVKIVGKDLIQQTIGVDALRASVDKVGIFLKESGTSSEAYVKALEAAHERLGIEMVKHKDITGLAARVHAIFDELPGAAEATRKAAAVGEIVH